MNIFSLQNRSHSKQSAHRCYKHRCKKGCAVVGVRGPASSSGKGCSGSEIVFSGSIENSIHDF